ncbi:hypothetical protein A0H81_02772 [Grifola frondosa]|uniref:Uncharacterized protein n=1 Tax=Grifola frondosa TaxID=5627 RepID=A0A1C7MMQ1_GRIFR|nr:hypothetical protein A0H81_02772 [Grifola frondosa]
MGTPTLLAFVISWHAFRNINSLIVPASGVYLLTPSGLPIERMIALRKACQSFGCCLSLDRGLVPEYRGMIEFK